MPCIIKIRFQVTGDVRRISLQEWPDLQSLHSQLTAMFGAELPSPYTLKYSDSDGDLISITSNPELREAVNTAGRGGVLNLIVGISTAGSSASVHLLPSAMPTPAPTSGAWGLYPPIFPSVSPSKPSLPPVSTSPSPHSIQIPDFSVTMSQAHDTLFIDDLAPAQFVSDFRTLLSLGYGWEQTRDALIDFGGDISQARDSLRSAPRRSSTPTTRHYFSASFARSVRELQSAGFTLRPIVCALIRNAGVASNAAIELSSLNTEVRCHNGHLMEVSSYNLGDYATQWYCDRCNKRDKPGQRWFCMSCKYDVCFNCQPAPRAQLPSVLVPKPTVPVVSDLSLPPSLLEPVMMLEAMGFNDRMKIIEFLVSNQGDIVRCATQLAEERRLVEEKEAQAKRQEQRRRQREEQRKAKEAEARARAQAKEAEARALAEAARLEAKRQEAAKVVVQTPEKIGADLAYLLGMGFDPVTSTSSLFNAGGNVQDALEELLKLQGR